MKTSLRTYLGISYFLVVLIGVGLAAGLTWLAVESLYVNTQRDNLLAQAQWIAKMVALQSFPAARSDPYSQLSNTTSGIHIRLIDAQSAAIIDLAAPGAPGLSGSQLELPQLAQLTSGLVSPDELMAREEIIQARQGIAATAIRKVAAAGGIPVIYAAVPLIASTGEVSQIIYLATPLPNTQWAALPGGIQLQLLGIVIAAIVLASGAGLFLARRIARPLNGVLNTVQTITAGDFSKQASEDRSIRELTRLSQGVNQMSQSLRQADLAKSHFIAGVSHELRTPLTVIKGTIETLQDGAIDDQAARGPFLEAMFKETERLIRIVNDLLILTRVDSGELHLKPKVFDLKQLACERSARLEKIASQAGVRLRVKETPDACVFAYADPDRITQVLDNLLENAIHYSPEHGEILLAFERVEQRVRCQISDQGPGIAAEHIPFLFDRFYRVDATRSRHSGGSGLGLAIVRELLKVQGGQIDVNSQVGQGTIFSFSLPEDGPSHPMTGS